MEFRPVKLAQMSTGADNRESATLRAFAVLEHIAAAEEPPTLEELTRAIGLPKPTIFRILRLLMRGGLVQREVHEKRYLVGERASALALEVQMQSPSRRERRAILSRLVEAIGETCNFTMLDGTDVVYLLSMFTEPDHRGEGHATRIVRAAMRWAKGRGIPLVVLHASELGESVYRRLGFERTREMRRSLVPAPRRSARSSRKTARRAKRS